MTGADDRVTVPDLAALLHCSERTAREFMGSEIPATRKGGRWTARRADVDRWLKQSTIVGRRRKGPGRSLTES